MLRTVRFVLWFADAAGGVAFRDELVAGAGEVLAVCSGDVVDCRARGQVELLVLHVQDVVVLLGG